MAGKTFRASLYYLGSTNPVRANVYHNTTLVKARARAIREYGNKLKSGEAQVVIEETVYDRPMMPKKIMCIIRFDLMAGKFYNISAWGGEDPRSHHTDKHILNKDGTLGRVIERRWR